MSAGSKKLWSIGMLLLAWAGSACSCDGESTRGRAPIATIHLLEVDESGGADWLIDFGQVPVGSRAGPIPVEIRNEGSAALRVEAKKPGAPFTSNLPAAGFDLPAGEGREITFSFAPTEVRDPPFETTVTLSTNERAGREHTIRLVGEGVVPQLGCEPSPLDFGQVLLGTERTLEARCTNLLDVPLSFTVSDAVGNAAQSFSSSVEGGDPDVTLPPGGALEVSVRFRSRSTGKSEAILPFVGEDGRRIAGLPLQAQVVSSLLQLDPAGCLDFGYVDLGASARRSLGLRNVGTEPIRLLSFDLASPDFSVPTGAPLVVPPQGRAELEVDFHPTAAGPLAATVAIGSDVPGAGISACVQGFGGGPRLACSPASIDFGLVAIGTPVSRLFTCTNVGLAPEGLRIDPLLVTGLHSDDPAFQVELRDPRGGSPGPRPSGYEVNESFWVQVSFHPDAEELRSGAIAIETNAFSGGATLPVQGEGRRLPPCDLSVTPPLLDFGIVDRGRERELAFRLENLQDWSCLINDLRLSDDSDPAFSLGPIESLELAAFGELLVPVRLAPTSYQSRILGEVIFQVSDPQGRDRSVPLRGSAAPPCLQIAPGDPIDFGRVSPGCGSRTRTITVSNVCSGAVEVQSAQVESALGSDEFEVIRPPPLPLTLLPQQSLELELRYAPEDEGIDRGILALGAADAAGGALRYLAALLGEGMNDAIQIDRFTYQPVTKADILWVIDNSGSMAPYQERIQDNLPAFVSIAEANRIDFHIAVTTTGIWPTDPVELAGYGIAPCPGGANGGEGGRFFPIDGSHPRILSPRTPDLETHWRANLDVGVCHGDEYPYEAAFLALAQPLIDEVKSSAHQLESSWDDGNGGFLRSDASLSLIFVTDERDHSTLFERSPSDYLAFFRSLKAQNPRLLQLHGITGPRESELDPSCYAEEGDRLLDGVDATGGAWLDICTPTSEPDTWSYHLRQMSEVIFGFKAIFLLTGQPADPGAIEVTVNGKVIPARDGSGATAWTYDPETNEVSFSPLYLPARGAAVSLTYPVACL